MPTFQNLRRGGGLIKAIPGMKIGTDFNGYKRNFRQGSKPFRSPSFSTSSLYITGITKDSTGTPLSSCVVDLYRTENESWIARTNSDGSGNYSFQILVGGPFFIVAYKAGGTDVAGTTVNTLTGS